MWTILVFIVSYTYGDQLRISPAPFAVVDEHSNLTLTCEYSGASVPISIRWYSWNYYESIILDMSCIPVYSSGALSGNTTFRCNDSIGKFQMSLTGIHRNRHGQIWGCSLGFSNSTDIYGERTMVDVRGNITETTCSWNHDVEICPYPIARVEENKTLAISVKINDTSASNYTVWVEYVQSLYHRYIFTINHNCTNLGYMPAGYNFTCNPSESTVTLILDQVQKERNGQMWMIVNKNIFISVQGTAPNTTNPVSTTISPNSTSTSSTSSALRSTSITTVMVPTTQPPPSYVPDPAPNTTNPVSTTISPNSTSTSSTSSALRSTSITTVMVPTTQPPPSYMPDPGEYELQLEFDLKVEMEYNESYADKTSSEFQSLATHFSVSLIEVFKNLKGFKSIDILRFRRGSVIVDYLVNVFATVDVATVIEDIGTTIVNNLTSIAGVPINTAYTHESMTNRLENLKTRDKCSLASATLCPFGYYCKPATTSIILCIDRCNSAVCQNNGECYVGHHFQDVQCRCVFSEKAVYSGKRCETKHEVMTMHERNTYLIIACSVIGGILLVCLSTVCVINRKRKRLKKKFTSRNILNLDEMHRTSNNGTRAIDDRYIISINPAFKRNPEECFDGRSHAYHQDQGLDDGYMQVQGNRDRYNSDPNYDYIHPR